MAARKNAELQERADLALDQEQPNLFGASGHGKPQGSGMPVKQLKWTTSIFEYLAERLRRAGG